MGYDREDDAFACSGEAPFPVWLPEHFIAACCPMGGTVLDPFAGTGSTLAAAYMLGRLSVGVERGDTQIAIARQRLQRLTEHYSYGHRTEARPGALVAVTQTP